MKVLEIEFKREYLWVAMDSRFSFCEYGVESFWDVPDEAARLILSLHTRSSKERHEAKIGLYDGQWPELNIRNSNDRYSFDDESLDEVLKKFIGKSLWLEAEYELKED